MAAEPTQTIREEGGDMWIIMIGNISASESYI
jgi:hypothetical protein